MKILVIIPVFNEEKNLEKCISSFINQTHKLSQITIVDDGSTDNTSQIGKRLEKSYKEILFIKKNDSETIASPGKKIIQAFNYGLNKSNKNYDLIGKFDADIELPKNYFEQMVNIFSKNKSIGLASGIISVNEKGNWVVEGIYNKNHVRGGLKLYNKSTFNQIDGLTESMGWDTLDEMKIYYSRKETFVDHSIICKQHRLTGERYNKKRYIKQGRVMYLLGYDIVLCLIGSIKFSFTENAIRPFFDSIYGYFNSLYKNEKKLVNNKLSKFVRSYRYQKILEKIGIYK